MATETDENMKQLSTVVGGSMTSPSKSSVTKLLDERLSMPEAIALATILVARYPTADKAGDGYIGAVAQTLCSYPASVARQCADAKGVVWYCKFLPSIAEIVNYCEGFTEPLRRQDDYERRTERQLAERKRLEVLETQIRPKRLSIKELKEKYGDWHDNFRVPGLKKQEIRDAARAKLIAEFGEEAFNAVPDAKPDPFADLED